MRGWWKLVTFWRKNIAALKQNRWIKHQLSESSPELKVGHVRENLAKGVGSRQGKHARKLVHPGTLWLLNDDPRVPSGLHDPQEDSLSFAKQTKPYSLDIAKKIKQYQTCFNFNHTVAIHHREKQPKRCKLVLNEQRNHIPDQEVGQPCQSVPW